GGSGSGGMGHGYNGARRLSPAGGVGAGAAEAGSRQKRAFGHGRARTPRPTAPTAPVDARMSRPSGGSQPASVSPWSTPTPTTRPTMPNHVRRALRRLARSPSRNEVTVRMALSPSSDATEISSSMAGRLSDSSRWTLHVLVTPFALTV